jgi:hypothetical protein
MSTQTTGLQIATFVIAVVALLISTGLAGLKVWETFFQRPRFKARLDWITGPLHEPILQWSITNVGRARGSVREIRLRTADMPQDKGWSKAHAIMDHLPVTLEPGETSQLFRIQLDPAEPHAFDRALVSGDIRLLDVVDGSDQITSFAVPVRVRSQDRVGQSGP